MAKRFERFGEKLSRGGWMSREEKLARAEDMKSRRERGESIGRIAAAWDLSRSRVYHILAAYQKGEIR